MRTRAGSGVVLLAAALLAPGCKRHGCLGGDDGICQPPTACPVPAEPVCGAPTESLRIGVVDRTSWTAARSPGPKSLGAVGDFVLENDLVRAVIDAPEHAQGLAPSGGTILDLAPRVTDAAHASAGDQLNGILQGVGLLPRDAARYHSAEMVHGEPGFVALVLRGYLDGNNHVSVVTRYELRACESGLRVRTELYNGTRETHTFWLLDGLFYGDRGLLPFAPLPGQGFVHPKLDLLELPKVWRHWPFIAARPQAPPFASYAIVPCSPGVGQGFGDSTFSASGVELAPTTPGDGLAFDRFILVAGGEGVAPAVGAALRARQRFFGEPAPVTVSGRVVAGEDRAPFDSRGGRAASILFYEPAPGADPDAEAGRRPWSEVVPGADGTFTAALPAGKALRAQPHAFGRPAGKAVALSTAGGRATIDLGDVVVERPARLLITVEEAAGKKTDFAEIVMIPVAEPARGAKTPSMYGLFGGCDPMLGPAHGGSPACNRALVADGVVDLLVPPGRFFVYATRGPFATIAREEVTIEPGMERALTLRSALLPLLPPGVLAGDFHVHSGASFDSSLPQIDRVVSLLATGIDVIAATDHDVVTDYGAALDALMVRDRLRIMPGAELTPNTLWFKVPGETFPKTLGHFNFWPLRHDPFLPRGGAPFDENLEPGRMMDAMDGAWAVAAEGRVRQMNHPWAASKLGRDEGFLRVLKYDPRQPIEAGRSFAADVILRRPGAGHRNLDFDTQEVMTGASRRDFIRYRALWFSFLNQGLLKAGVANSDSHTLMVERVGYPRTLVFADQDGKSFDAVSFNAALKAGRAIGTNGPVVDARIVDGAAVYRPGLAAAAIGRDADVVVTVAAAPWIPVSEVRFVVNGKVVRTVLVRLGAGDDPFGRDQAAELKVPLVELVAGVAGDAWLVVEAGLALPLSADLDNDGLADTLDNNGDGKIDAADVPPDPDDEDVRFPDPRRPPAGDARFHLEAIAPGIWPAAFTNPFVLDLDDGGWKAPGLR